MISPTIDMSLLTFSQASLIPFNLSPKSPCNSFYENILIQYSKKAGKWTHEEDELLRKYVQIYGEKQWRKISQHIPGRTSIQCLHRWSKILRPGLVKGPWTPEEDQKLISWVKTEGPNKWAQAANLIVGRSGKQCRERWFNNLNPEVKKGDWSKEEDELLFSLYKKYGSSWSTIANYISGRTENAIKNRFYSTLRKIVSDNSKAKQKHPLMEKNVKNHNEEIIEDASNTTTEDENAKQPSSALYDLLWENMKDNKFKDFKDFEDSNKALKKPGTITSFLKSFTFQENTTTNTAETQQKALKEIYSIGAKIVHADLIDNQRETENTDVSPDFVGLKMNNLESLEVSSVSSSKYKNFQKGNLFKTLDASDLSNPIVIRHNNENDNFGEVYIPKLAPLGVQRDLSSLHGVSKELKVESNTLFSKSRLCSPSQLPLHYRGSKIYDNQNLDMSLPIIIERKPGSLYPCFKDRKEIPQESHRAQASDSETNERQNAQNISIQIPGLVNFPRELLSSLTENTLDQNDTDTFNRFSSLVNLLNKVKSFCTNKETLGNEINLLKENLVLKRHSCDVKNMFKDCDLSSKCENLTKDFIIKQFSQRERPNSELMRKKTKLN